MSILSALGGAIKGALSSEGITGGIATAIESYITKDAKLAEAIEKSVENARKHDIATQVKGYAIVDVTRGLVRPVISFAAMCWYVYARMNDIPLLSEDYAIIGGILAFWFGMRPFDKRKSK